MSDGSKEFYFYSLNHMALYKGSQKVSGSGNSFNPQNAGTTGQVLSKTASGYEWDDAPATGIGSSNDTYEDIIYLSQSDYDNLDNKDPNTLYSTPDDETTFVSSVNGRSGTVSVNEPIISSTAPSSPTEGMIWYDTTNGILKVYDGNSWEAVGSTTFDSTPYTQAEYTALETNTPSVLTDGIWRVIYE